MGSPNFEFEWDPKTVKECVRVLNKKQADLKQIPQAVRLATNEARRVSQSETPRKTGTLQNSYRIEYSDGGKKSRITNEAKNSSGKPYAVFPEFGKGRGWSGKEQHFMRDGQKAGHGRLLKECKKLLEVKT